MVKDRGLNPDLCDAVAVLYHLNYHWSTGSWSLYGSSVVLIQYANKQCNVICGTFSFSAGNCCWLPGGFPFMSCDSKRISPPLIVSVNCWFDYIHNNIIMKLTAFVLHMLDLFVFFTKPFFFSHSVWIFSNVGISSSRMFHKFSSKIALCRSWHWEISQTFLWLMCFWVSCG